MLRRNYRRTRSDETDVRSATGEELTGVMTSSADGGGGRKQKSRGDPTARPNAMKTGAGNGAPSSSSRSTAAAEDDSGAADSVDNSPRSGHHYRHHHRPVTPSASCRGTPRPFRHNPSVGSTDTEMTSLDARELWLPDTEPTPSTMSALHQFGAEMLRLSRGLEKVASPESKPASPDTSRSVSTRRTCYSFNRFLAVYNYYIYIYELVFFSIVISHYNINRLLGKFRLEAFSNHFST